MVMHLHQLYLSRGSKHLYGFIDPLSLQIVGNKACEIQKYLHQRLSNRKKRCYLAPYYYLDNLGVMNVFNNVAQFLEEEIDDIKQH
ncbi:hypothetical protein CR513_58633, partial [Mucuna pruriens]